MKTVILMLTVVGMEMFITMMMMLFEAMMKVMLIVVLMNDDCDAHVGVEMRTIFPTLVHAFVRCLETLLHLL